MATVHAYVPEGMSYVNAYRALWLQAEPVGYFAAHEEALRVQENQASTAEKVATLFRKYSTHRSPLFYMEYEGGRMIKVHFVNFPKLEVYYYDTKYGAGAAQRALDAYNATPRAERFDPNDSYSFNAIRFDIL